MSEDTPFIYHKGENKRNQVEALNRINYLVRQQIPNFDIQTLNDAQRRFLDTTLLKEYYATNPSLPIDEDFCQRAAKLLIEYNEEK